MSVTHSEDYMSEDEGDDVMDALNGGRWEARDGGNGKAHNAHKSQHSSTLAAIRRRRLAARSKESAPMVHRLTLQSQRVLETKRVPCEDHLVERPPFVRVATSHPHTARTWLPCYLNQSPGKGLTRNASPKPYASRRIYRGIAWPRFAFSARTGAGRAHWAMAK